MDTDDPRLTKTLPPTPPPLVKPKKKSKPPKPKVGVVLGSGGMKAFAAIPLFEFLDQAGIAVDLLVGCSGGAIMCAAIGSGLTPAGIRQIAPDILNSKIFGSFNYRAILSIFSSRFGRFTPSSSIIRPDRMREIYQYLWGDKKLEDLCPRTLVQATDLMTGEGVVLSRGSVVDAVYASGAFFPVLPPLEIEGRWLSDGAYSAPVPVIEAVKRNMDVIIALDFAERSTVQPEGFFDCFYRYIDTQMTTLKRSQMFQSIELHHHEIINIQVNFDQPISFRAANALDAVLAKGAEAVAHNKEAILAAIHSFAETRREE